MMGTRVQLDDFFYRFPLSDLANVQVDFARAELNDNVFTASFDGGGALSRFGRFNPIYRQGAEGAGLTLNILPEGANRFYLLTPRGNDPNRSLDCSMVNMQLLVR